ncbi:MAG: glycoside hydrolase family 97 catalytic domain-containing protein [Bacteroidaceae bacterium]|nr:glycoside hydrolase family 97 catalytic domain-containing protein [Bacteroidaceae bacterium]
MTRYYAKLLTLCLFLTACCPAFAQQAGEENEMLCDADTLMTAVMAKLFDQNGSGASDSQRYQWSDRYVRGSAKGGGNTTIWPQGFGLAALSQMALAMQGTDSYETYKKAANRLVGKFSNYITTINGIRGYSVYGGAEHRFLDDNAWAALGLLDAYEMDNRSTYLTAIKMVGNYMVSAGRLLEENPPGGGGMYWQDSPADDTNTYKTKNVANNGPAVVIFCRLFEITNDSTWLDYAKMTYQWLYDTLLDKSSWLMWDNINVETNEINKYQAPYTTGAMLHAASILYSITGESAYKKHADKIAEAAFRRWFETYYSSALGKTIKIVKDESNTHSDDIVVLMRGFEAYAAISDDKRYMTAFYQSLRHIWATRRDAETGLMNYSWTGTASQDEWTSLGQTGYVEMYARLARAVQGGWVPNDNMFTPFVIEAESTTKSSGVTTETDTRCSGGKRVGYLGNGKTLTFSFNAEQEGIYELTVYYMTYGTRRLEIKVNGTDDYAFGCPSTDSWDGSNIGNISVNVVLQEGNNTFVVGNASGDAPNLDKFELLYVGPKEEEEPPVDMSDALAATSPDGNLEVKVKADESGRAFYAVTLAGTPVLAPSQLGIEGRSIFPSGLTEHSIEDVSDPYDLMHGKASHVDNHYTELRTTFSGSTPEEQLTVVFRIYDDAVALRYEMESGSLTHFEHERTEFNFATFKQALALEYHKSYEWYYYLHPWEELVSSPGNKNGYCEPMLVQVNSDTYALLTEACHIGQHAGSKIVQGSKQGSLRMELVATNDADTVSTITYPFASAWRTLIVGGLSDIVESTAVQSLNPAPDGDFSWVKPGRVAWNWAGEDRKNTGDINVAKRYVDLAQHLGWEYVLIDEGWENNINLSTFVSYARQHDVNVIVWYHQNKFTDSYSACLSKFRSLANQGVKGVKIDFFEDDKQATIKKYQTLLRAAKTAKLMVDFHGSTRPTGWERTYPNLMTMEAVLGGEMLLDQPHMNQADHSANLVLTRNAIGPMDFTPTKLAQRTGSLKTHSNTDENPFTTWSYQLALWTLFESGFQCLIDCPDNVIDSPFEPVLRQVPTAWDETLCLEADPTKYATLARRSGEDWFVATVSKNQRAVRIPLKFLEEGKQYTAYIYRDGTCSFDIAYQKRTVTSATNLSISVKPNGGATVIITTDENRPYLRAISYEAESAIGGTRQSNAHCSGGYNKSRIQNDTKLKFTRVKTDFAGEHALTLYYMLPEETRRAYIQVGDEGDKIYYDFHMRDDYDRSKGLVLGMKTIYVQLQEGTNIIYYGCEDGQAPDLDKISVTPTQETLDIYDGIREPGAVPTNVEQALRLDGDCIVCSTLDEGTLSLFDTSGRLLQKVPVGAGETRVKVSARGFVIASLSVNARAFARKFIVL